MPKLLAPSNFSLSNLAFIIVDLENVENFEDSPRVTYAADEREVESPCMVFRKSFTFINFQ